MSVESPSSNDNLHNSQVTDSEVPQKKGGIDDSHRSKTLLEFNVNAHGHKPTQLIVGLLDEMGDNTNSNNKTTEDTNTGDVTEEQRGLHASVEVVANETLSDSVVTTDLSNEENVLQPCKIEQGTSDKKVVTGKDSETQSDPSNDEKKKMEMKTESRDANKETEVDTVTVNAEANTDKGESSSCCEYKEISSDEDPEEDHEDLTEKADADSSTSSPSQISPDHRHTKHGNRNHEENQEDETGMNPDRPDSLSLPRPLQFLEKQKYRKYHHKRGKSDSSFASDVSRSSSTDALIDEASKTPLSSQGTVIQDGDMIAFVAEGLNDLIKLSSTPSQTDSSMSSSLRSPGEKSVSSVSSSTSAWSDITSSASEWSRDCSRMSRSPSILTASPDDIPPVDPRAVMDLELHAVKVANSVDHMLGTMKNNLHKMSALSYHSLDAHNDAVDSTCDSVDSSIKCMYALMAKCEELSKAMKPVYNLHTQVKEIERLLDLFEGQIAKEDK